MEMVQRTIHKKVRKMKNNEQIQKDLAIACDFLEQIIANPSILDKIPYGCSISFLDNENIKPEKKIKSTKYVKVKRHFEVL